MKLDQGRRNILKLFLIYIHIQTKLTYTFFLFLDILLLLQNWFIKRRICTPFKWLLPIFIHTIHIKVLDYLQGDVKSLFMGKLEFVS